MNRVATTIAAILGGIATLLLTATLIAPQPVIAHSSSPLPAKTGAPGENTCIQCHNDFTANDGVGEIVFAAPPEYTPGQTYTLGIGVARTGSLRWGFELTVIDANGNAAGTLTDTTVPVGKQTSGGREYLSHTNAKGGDGTFPGVADAGAWVFDWTAPAQGTGTVTFFFAGVACDNDDGNGGDYVYSGSSPSAEGASTDVKTNTWGEIKTIYR